MTWRVSELRHRVQIREGVQTPNTSGGADRTYNIKATVWASMKPIPNKSASYIRGQQIEDTATHTFIVRRNVSLGVDFIGDSLLLKKDHFLFVEIESDKKTGRLFDIIRVINIDERNEYIKITTREMEKQEGQGLVI